ncbi:MAG: hypothetical protein ACMUJM_24695 [bacterium]
MKIKTFFILQLLFALTTCSAFGNGICGTLSQIPQSKTPFLNEKKFGFARINGDKVILLLYYGSVFREGEEYFGDFNEKHWLSSSAIANMPNSFEVSLFSKYGFVCNVKIKAQKSGKFGPYGEETYNVEGQLSEDSFNRLKNLPKYSKVLFMYPSINSSVNSLINSTINNDDRILITEFSHQAISQYIKDNNLHKNINLRFLKTEVKIELIGGKETINQYAVVCKVGTRLAFKTFYTLLDTFFLIIEVAERKIIMRRIDFLPKGADSSGDIICEVIGDINQDGLADIFLIRAGCCAYVIVFDGEKWIQIGHTIPA